MNFKVSSFEFKKNLAYYATAEAGCGTGATAERTERWPSRAEYNPAGALPGKQDAMSRNARPREVYNPAGTTGL